MGRNVGKNGKAGLSKSRATHETDIGKYWCLCWFWEFEGLGGGVKMGGCEYDIENTRCSRVLYVTVLMKSSKVCDCQASGGFTRSHWISGSYQD